MIAMIRRRMVVFVVVVAVVVVMIMMMNMIVVRMIEFLKTVTFIRELNTAPKSQ